MECDRRYRGKRGPERCFSVCLAVSDALSVPLEVDMSEGGVDSHWLDTGPSQAVQLEGLTT